MRWLVLCLLVGGCAAHRPCPGDCNGDGRVTDDEVQIVAAVALGRADQSYCPKNKWLHDGRIGPDDLAAAIDAKNNGCP